MAASRFPGKPLHKIAGRPLLEHCFLRGQLYEHWDEYFIATCDEEIGSFADEHGFPWTMTSDRHTRALDRIAEAAETCVTDIRDEDIVICVQGDEPLLHPEMIEAITYTLTGDPAVGSTMLAVPILEEDLYYNPDIVKIVHSRSNVVLYTSRSPIPYGKEFSAELGAKRVGGIFGFRWSFLKWFMSQPESPLEIAESCDSNRICDNGFQQKISLVSHRPYFSVDSPADVQRVEQALAKDTLWGTY